MGRKPNDLGDETNWRILEEIQRDGRIAFKEIGDRIGLSCSAVSERVKRMEEAGLIQGFTARLDEEKIGLGIRAIIAVKCHSPVKEQELLEKLPGLFSDRRKHADKDREETEAELYRQIGQLKVELDWLKKKSEKLLS